MRRGIFGAMALAGAMMAVPAMASQPVVIEAERHSAPRESRARRSRPVAAPVKRRSKNPPHKRKLRANRLHVSRRVRRKHRRAA